MVALIDLNRGPWSTPIEAPGVNRLERTDLLLHHLGNQEEDLRVALHRVGKITDVGSHDRHVEGWPRMRVAAAVRSPILRIGKHSRCGKQSRAETVSLLNDRA